jgi:hypothetical protein
MHSHQKLAFMILSPMVLLEIDRFRVETVQSDRNVYIYNDCIVISQDSIVR